MKKLFLLVIILLLSMSAFAIPHSIAIPHSTQYEYNLQNGFAGHISCKGSNFDGGFNIKVRENADTITVDLLRHQFTFSVDQPKAWFYTNNVIGADDPDWLVQEQGNRILFIKNNLNTNKNNIEIACLSDSSPYVNDNGERIYFNQYGISPEGTDLINPINSYLQLYVNDNVKYPAYMQATELEVEGTTSSQDTDINFYDDEIPLSVRQFNVEPPRAEFGSQLTAGKKTVLISEASKQDGKSFILPKDGLKVTVQLISNFYFFNFGGYIVKAPKDFQPFKLPKSAFENYGVAAPLDGTFWVTQKNYFEYKSNSQYVSDGVIIHYSPGNSQLLSKMPELGATELWNNQYVDAFNSNTASILGEGTLTEPTVGGGLRIVSGPVIGPGLGTDTRQDDYKSGNADSLGYSNRDLGTGQISYALPRSSLTYQMGDGFYCYKESYRTWDSKNAIKTSCQGPKVNDYFKNSHVFSDEAFRSTNTIFVGADRICQSHTDGTSMQLYCYGHNGNYQAKASHSGVANKYTSSLVGNSQTPDAAKFRSDTLVSFPVGVSVYEVEFGEFLTCARTGPTGQDQVYCWGKSNQDHQLNDYIRGYRNQDVADYHTPQPINFNWVVNDIAIGDDYLCINSKGKVYCAGKSNRGQSGNTNDYTTFVQVSNLENVREIVSGGDFTCALIDHVKEAELDRYNAGRESMTDSEIKCWGDNSKGQLGAKNVDYSRTPVSTRANQLVNQETQYGAFTIQDISAKDSTLCITGTDRFELNGVFCRGNNDHGELGRDFGNDFSYEFVHIYNQIQKGSQLIHGKDNVCIQAKRFDGHGNDFICTNEIFGNRFEDVKKYSPWKCPSDQLLSITNNGQNRECIDLNKYAMQWQTLRSKIGAVECYTGTGDPKCDWQKGENIVGTSCREWPDGSTVNTGANTDYKCGLSLCPQDYFNYNGVCDKIVAAEPSPPQPPAWEPPFIPPVIVEECESSECDEDFYVQDLSRPIVQHWVRIQGDDTLPSCRDENSYDGPKICDFMDGQDLSNKDCSDYQIGLKINTKYSTISSPAMTFECRKINCPIDFAFENGECFDPTVEQKEWKLTNQISDIKCSEKNKYRGPQICDWPSEENLDGYDCSEYDTGLIISTADHNTRDFTNTNFECQIVRCPSGMNLKNGICEGTQFVIQSLGECIDELGNTAACPKASGCTDKYGNEIECVQIVGSNDPVEPDNDKVVVPFSLDEEEQTVEEKSGNTIKDTVEKAFAYTDENFGFILDKLPGENRKTQFYIFSVAVLGLSYFALFRK